jgi:hypothetical protein
MYKLAVAILLLSAPAFAQDNSENKPNMPPTNMKNTVIPKSGGEQTPATTTDNGRASQLTRHHSSAAGENGSGANLCS